MSYYSQSINQPLYEDILWNKPETKALAGKLLIIGGNSHSISAPNLAYSQAYAYGAGETRVALPSATQHYFKKSTVPHDIVFAESTLSGSFSTVALKTLQGYAAWADYILFIGDLTKNSETTTVIADILSQLSLPTTIVGDAIEALQPYATDVLQRQATTVCIMTMSQLQKYVQVIGYHTALTSTLAHNRLTAWLEEFSLTINAIVVLSHAESVYIAAAGTVIATLPFTNSPDNMQHLAVAGSVWAMQHPARRAEAIATAITQIK